MLPRYMLTGLTGTSLHYVVMWTVISSEGSEFLGTTIGALSGAFVNYHFCRQWVFKRKRKILRKRIYLRYSLTVLAVIVLNSVAFLVFRQFTALWLAQALATVTACLMGFVFNQNWTFNEPGEAVEISFDSKH